MTAGVEAASAGWIDRARHVALEDDRVADGSGLRHRHGREHSCRYRRFRGVMASGDVVGRLLFETGRNRTAEIVTSGHRPGKDADRPEAVACP
jgi:hypothetical protein